MPFNLSWWHSKFGGLPLELLFTQFWNCYGLSPCQWCHPILFVSLNSSSFQYVLIQVDILLTFFWLFKHLSYWAVTPRCSSFLIYHWKGNSILLILAYYYVLIWGQLSSYYLILLYQLHVPAYSSYSYLFHSLLCLRVDFFLGNKQRNSKQRGFSRQLLLPPWIEHY